MNYLYRVRFYNPGGRENFLVAGSENIGIVMQVPTETTLVISVEPQEHDRFEQLLQGSLLVDSYDCTPPKVTA